MRISLLIVWVIFGEMSAQAADDPFLWLESATSPAATQWVAQENAKTTAVLTADARFEPLRAQTKALLTAPDRLPYVLLMGPMVYNFWQDAAHPRGLWRRALLGEFAQNREQWDTVLDLDALATQESADWVWMGATCLPPAYRRCLLNLSHGGKDAQVVREFDTVAKAFVADGFVLPEAKSTVSWLDVDTLLIGTDWGPGSLTRAGYPAQVRQWQRGSDWRQATMILSSAASDVSMAANVIQSPDGPLALLEDSISMFESKHWLRHADGSLTLLAIPQDAEVLEAYRGLLILRMRSAWSPSTPGSSAMPVGSVVAYDPNTTHRSLIYAPGERATVTSVAATATGIVVNALDNVASRLLLFTADQQGQWQPHELTLPVQGTATIYGSSAFSSLVLLTLQNFLSPTALYQFDTSSIHASGIMLRQAPQRFPAADFSFEQFTATSRDGTMIPYFVVHRRDWQLSRKNPTLLYGYGGFEIALTPTYSAMLGQAWLAKGGIYVVANIRGGGEFGPAWHLAAVKEQRQHAFDDFLAVASDLEERGITDADHLGIRGGSNGGLLVGAVMTQRPELFHAVVCEVPLLDMLRFPLLGAGASWEGEYGSPDVPAERAALLAYSPYHRLQAGRHYPMPLFLTSTGDDRVTPAHARKMAAAMAAAGDPYLFYETAAGGHATPASVEDEAFGQASQFVYLYQQLMDH